MKQLTVRLLDSETEKIEYYREKQDISITQADFIRKALNEKCEKTRKLRSGDMILEIPNPNHIVMTEEQKIEVIREIAELTCKLMKINPGLTFGLDEILQFAKSRLITDRKEVKEKFEQNFQEDLKFEEGK